MLAPSKAQGAALARRLRDKRFELARLQSQTDVQTVCWARIAIGRHGFPACAPASLLLDQRLFRSTEGHPPRFGRKNAGMAARARDPGSNDLPSSSEWNQLSTLWIPFIFSRWFFELSATGLRRAAGQRAAFLGR
jgi:hypothetical protein